MPCFLGIDHGGKRIGLAVSDPPGRLALSIPTLAVGGSVPERVLAVLKIAEQYDVAAFVVGLPLNMDDSEGPQAKLARAFGEELKRRGQKPVHFQDERLSSAAADELLQAAEFTRKKHKARRDRVAAQVILQDFLDANRSSA